MPVDRFFIEGDLEPRAEIHLVGQEYHHLAHVTRAKGGDRVEVVNGKGDIAEAVVEAIKKKEAVLHIASVRKESPPTSNIILVQAIPRLNRLETIVEKGTELGMAQLWLFPGERSEKGSLTENQEERLRVIAISAMKQCGRLWLPIMKILPPLKQWKTLPMPSYFGDVSPGAPPLLRVWESQILSVDAYIFIGPESGFSKEEEELLVRHGATGVTLHANILRTDTAAIAALAIMSNAIVR